MTSIQASKKTELNMRTYFPKKKKEKEKEKTFFKIVIGADFFLCLTASPTGLENNVFDIFGYSRLRLNFSVIF